METNTGGTQSDRGKRNARVFLIVCVLKSRAFFIKLFPALGVLDRTAVPGKHHPGIFQTTLVPLSALTDAVRKH